MAEKCPTCEKTVYWAEQVYSLGKSWHKLCLKCDRCSKLLTAGGHAEHDGMPYCYIPCYANLFGPRGVNIGGAGSHKYDSSGNNSPAAVDDSAPEVEDKTACVPKEPEDEGATFSTSVETPKKKKTWALKVMKRIRYLLAGRLRRIKQRRSEDKASSELDSKIISTGAVSHMDETPVTYSNTVDSSAPTSEEKRARAPKGPEKAVSNTTVSVFGITKLCPRCNKKVYFAEKVTSLGKDWHRPCLSCERCRKTLSPGSHAEHNGQPYCHKPCYADMFGPHVVTSWVSLL